MNYFLDYFLDYHFRDHLPTDGRENSNLTVVPAALWTDFAGSNDVCVSTGSMHNNREQLALS